MRRLLVFTLTLLLTVPAAALVLESGDGQGNTTPPADDPGWAYVGRVSGPSGIYLGNGWMLTANHVTVSDPEIEGVVYPVVPGTDRAAPQPRQLARRSQGLSHRPEPEPAAAADPRDDAPDQHQPHVRRSRSRARRGDELDGHRRLSLEPRQREALGHEQGHRDRHGQRHAPPSRRASRRCPAAAAPRTRRGRGRRFGRGHVHQEREHEPVGARGRDDRHLDLRGPTGSNQPLWEPHLDAPISRSTAAS